MKFYAMVLVYEPELRNSRWQDFISRCRTPQTLERQLNAGIKSGEWIAWRIIQIEKQVWGNGSPDAKPKGEK